ncbi:similar to Sm protein B [Cyanidioschyzon merolae strain 10D]|jgi:small nuclear ribonucleoprotein (snRNP)-like protein|uniref:Sm protein B n=1 Tax=Cyanidioschyzon merolae (strain NIES-3377 / 10D) TaxID=280699 RepID=M1V5C3_CYAM1|nr:similar to Sm protein B [Cyanidioschyzon merolae strain 10D]BAM80420.1 similar to Sm protein B [Cyanidioschyzon merolae strain 10D]|eukprot:XP_005536456.1 similar to Sm protein B [Cyanidioschyzon merolae strain 10D]
MDLLPVLRSQVHVQTTDGRLLAGKLLAFDAHSNLLLSHCTERRGESAKRYLGMVLVRGEHVLAVITPRITETEQKTAASE